MIRHLPDLLLSALLCVLAWSFTPVGAAGSLIAEELGGPHAHRDLLDAFTAPWRSYRAGPGEAPLAPEVPGEAPRFPEPWRTATRLTLQAPYQVQLWQKTHASSDAELLAWLDARDETDPREALAALLLDDADRAVALEAARALGSPAPDSLEAQRPHLPRHALDRLDHIAALAENLHMAWPVEEGARVSSPFGDRVHPTLGTRRFHNGVDLAIPVGSQVHAPRRGVVRAIRRGGVSGVALILLHGEGVETAYAHLSQVLVEEGDAVEAGDLIALSGNTGRSTGPHLHFTVRVGRRAVDPLPLRGTTRSEGVW
ncbi:MAG: M23 family metallopeptidase [Deltaproteobacteria bacterium]|nr:M23 family metallopeptidase [Deltaproteobacteria bacterium]